MNRLATFTRRGARLGALLTVATFGLASLPGQAQSNPEGLPEDVLDALDQRQATLVLAKPGQEAPVVVIAANASEVVRFAAKELSEHLTKITGTAIEVMDEGAAPKGRKVIALGPGEWTKGYDVSKLGIEEYILDIKPEGVVIVGGAREPLQGPDGATYARERGTLYGVYEFLENLGVRWYRPEPWGWHLPKTDTIELTLRRKISAPPAFVGRGAVRLQARWDGQTPQGDTLIADWAARHRFNVRSSQESRYGGWAAIGMKHAHSRLISPARYLKAHPDYFALVNGERGNPGSGRLPQLCLGNPELQEEFAKVVTQEARANPYSISIPVDPEDGTHRGRRMCTCERCLAMDDPANPEVMSNRVFKFTNIVARKLAKEVPEARVGLYAYSMHTEVPTLVDKIEPNVIVGFANINSWSDWTKKLFDTNSPANAQFVSLVEGWKKILQSAPWMREYSAYGWQGPIPMVHLLQDRVQSYRKLGIEGFEWPGEPNFGPQLLLLYFKAKLQWDPDLDVDKELALFYRNYYGPAAAPMKAYHEKWMAAFEQSQLGSGLSAGVSSGGRGIHLLCTPALLEELGQSIEEAKTLAKGKQPYEQRLRGSIAGYELSRRVGEILSLKLREGREVALPPLPDMPERTYLESAKANAAWEALKQWMLEANAKELTFEVANKEGEPSSVALRYMERDILKNGRYTGSVNERELLTANGFDKEISTKKSTP